MCADRGRYSAQVLAHRKSYYSFWGPPFGLAFAAFSRAEVGLHDLGPLTLDWTLLCVEGRPSWALQRVHQFP